MLCTKQGIALRGKEEDIKDDGKNPGNLLALLKDYARDDGILFEHIYKPKNKNSPYMSTDTQNIIIKILGDIVQAELLEEVRIKGMSGVPLSKGERPDQTDIYV